MLIGEAGSAGRMASVTHTCIGHINRVVRRDVQVGWLKQAMAKGNCADRFLLAAEGLLPGHICHRVWLDVLKGGLDNEKSPWKH